MTTLATVFCMLLAAALLHWLILALIPRLKMRKAMKQIVSAAGVNSFYHWPPVSSHSRNVVKPAPELNYSVAVLELSGGPVEVVLAGCPAAYCSVSFYSPRSDNFHVVNCDGAHELCLNVCQKRHASKLIPDGVEQVTAPAARVIAVVRGIEKKGKSQPASKGFQVHTAGDAQSAQSR